METDPSVIYGDWKLDPVESASVLTKLGEKTSVAKARKQWGNYWYRISRKILKTFQGADLIGVIIARWICRNLGYCSSSCADCACVSSRALPAAHR